MQESQVYWDEYKDPAAKHYGTLLKIEVPKDALVLFGDVDATSASIISLKASEVLRGFACIGITRLEAKVRSMRFLLMAEAPSELRSLHVMKATLTSWESILRLRLRGVHRQVAGDKRRIRLWGKNRGVSTAITLSDV